MSAAGRHAADVEEDARLVPVYDEVNTLLESLPDAPDDGGLALYRQILGAGSWRELDAPWSGKAMSLWAGQVLIIDAVHRMPSTTESRLNYYVVAHGALRETGDEVVFLTSSLAAVIQLVNAHVHLWLPMTCIPRVAKRPTRRGRTAQWLDIVDGPAPVRLVGT